VTYNVLGKMEYLIVMETLLD
jgi:hypothetical protein